MSQDSSYERHAMFVAPARTHAALWRLLAGFFLAGIIYVLLDQSFLRMIEGVDLDHRANSGAFGMYALLATFGFMIVGVTVSARVLHNRGFFSLLGPIRPLIQDFRATVIAILAVMIVIFILPPWDMGAPLLQNMPFGTWLSLLVPSLFFIFIQVTSEEIVFRGYVQQQLAARFQSPVIWMVLPSTLFALGHYVPQEAGENAFLIAAWSGIFGILMADLTARSGSLGPAIAVHFCNNISAIMFVSLPDSLSDLALYLAPFSMADTAAMRAWLPVDFAMMFVYWLAARLALRR
ncbi:MAG: CPBP family intramembrane glutamic endopeptidase [Sulfitobacter sp.]